MSDDNGALERIKQDLLDLADYAYGRLRARLEGLTDGEYLWEPAEGCWSVRAVGDGTFRSDGSPVPIEPAPLTTIAWRLCHIIDLLSAERNATWIGVTPAGPLNHMGEPGTAPDGIEQLERARGILAVAERAGRVGARPARGSPWARARPGRAGSRDWPRASTHRAGHQHQPPPQTERHANFGSHAVY